MLDIPRARLEKIQIPEDEDNPVEYLCEERDTCRQRSVSHISIFNQIGMVFTFGTLIPV